MWKMSNINELSFYIENETCIINKSNKKREMKYLHQAKRNTERNSQDLQQLIITNNLSNRF